MNRGRFGGTAFLPPPRGSLERGGLGRSGWGVEEGTRKLTLWKAPGGGVPASPGPGGRASRCAQGEPLCAGLGAGHPERSHLLPAARLGACCFLLGISLLSSRLTSGAPAPSRARGPQSRSLVFLWLLGRHSASVPLTIPLPALQRGARDPLSGWQIGGLCLLLASGGWFCLVCLFGFFFPLSLFVFAFGFFFLFFFWFCFLLFFFGDW